MEFAFIILGGIVIFSIGYGMGLLFGGLAAMEKKRRGTEFDTLEDVMRREG